MDRRKAEIEEKRAKLSELKRARVERKKGLSNVNKASIDTVGLRRYGDSQLTRLFRVLDYQAIQIIIK